MVFTYHSALNKVHEILKKALRHTVRLPRLSAVLPAPPRFVFGNPKTLKNHLVRSKLKIRKNGIDKCGNINCDVFNALYLSNEFESIVKGKNNHINFKFDCNSINMIYVLTYKRYRMQCVVSIFTKFCM